MLIKRKNSMTIFFHLFQWQFLIREDAKRLAILFIFITNWRRMFSRRKQKMLRRLFLKRSDLAMLPVNFAIGRLFMIVITSDTLVAWNSLVMSHHRFIKVENTFFLTPQEIFHVFFVPSSTTPSRRCLQVFFLSADDDELCWCVSSFLALPKKLFRFAYFSDAALL